MATTPRLFAFIRHNSNPIRSAPLRRPPSGPPIERNPVAKTKAQVEKRKREAEKRKKTEKIILKLAAAKPEDKVEHRATPPSAESRTTTDRT